MVYEESFITMKLMWHDKLVLSLNICAHETLLTYRSTRSIAASPSMLYLRASLATMLRYLRLASAPRPIYPYLSAGLHDASHLIPQAQEQ